MSHGYLDLFIIFYFPFYSRSLYFPLYLELLHAGHVVAEHAILQHGDGVALAADLLDLLTCAVAERGRDWCRDVVGMH